jgi:esterase
MLHLHTAEYGSPRAPALIILHGFLGSADNWHTLARRFSETVHVLSPDARNHGRSPHSDEFSYAAMADDVIDLMSEHRLTQTALLGHSMGGRTAMEVTLRRPDLVRALIVVDIAPRTYTPRHDEILDALQSVDLSVVTERSEVEQQLARSITSPAVRQFLMKSLGRNEEGRFLWKMNLPVLERSYPEVLRGIEGSAVYEGPALFIRGARSGYVTDEDILAIREPFPGARVVTLDSGHWVHAEQPELFARAVLDFLA